MHKFLKSPFKTGLLHLGITKRKRQGHKNEVPLPKISDYLEKIKVKTFGFLYFYLSFRFIAVFSLDVFIYAYRSKTTISALT